jgi:hypothetical protein
MHKILEKVDKELKEFEGKQSLTMGELQCIQMLVEIKKGILKIEMLEEGGSSHDDESYERGYSERRRRDSRGRFRSSYDGDGSYRGTYEGHYDGSYDGGNYHGSYDGGSYGHIEGKHEMIRDLRGMMERCKDPESRETIQKWMSQLEHAK